MDQELIAYLDERFRETVQQIASLREETSRNFEQTNGRLEQVDDRFEQMNGRFDRVETAIRHTQVEVEGMRGEIRLLTEGHMSTDEKLERFRDETAKNFEEIRGLIKISHMDLQGRVKSLEAWRERRDQTDPMDLIRERYGKKP